MRALVTGAAHERGRAGDRYLLGGDDLPLRKVFAIVAKAAGRAAPRVALREAVADCIELPRAVSH